MSAAWLAEFLALAWFAMCSRWLRSLLSILGIAIGILAFTVTASISLGGRALVFSELQTFGLRSVWIARDDMAIGLDGALLTQGGAIDNDDLADLGPGSCSAVSMLTPLVFSNDSRPVRSGNGLSNSDVLGIGLAYLEVNHDQLTEGRPFSEQDQRYSVPVALIGPQTARDLFHDQRNIVGRRLEIGEFTVEIKGVLAEKKRDFLNSIGVGKGEDINRRVLLPYPTLQRMQARTDLSTLQLESSSADNAQLAASQVIHVLQRNHGKKFNYKADDMQKYVAAADHILGTVSLIGLTASALSLLIGGIGIANVMAVSVLERTREIGVRKAIGASRNAVLLQFGLESVLISLIGGALGITMSYAAISVARQFTSLALMPDTLVVLYALLVSGLTGILAGLYPAFTAATMRPCDALRA